MKNIILSKSLSISSLEISDLVQSRHDKVKQSIERLANKHVIRLPPMGISENINNLGFKQETKYYIFTGDQGKRDSIIVVAQLSPEFTARLVDRWQELESNQQNLITLPNFHNPAEAARAWADEVEKNQHLLVVNQEQTQKIESLESLFKHGESVTQFCKKLNGVNVMLVSNFLEKKNWLYNESRLGVRWRVKSYARDKYMTEEVTEITPHGLVPFIINKPVLLRKGAVKLYEFYLKGELPMKKSWNGVYTQDKELRGVA